MKRSIIACSFFAILTAVALAQEPPPAGPVATTVYQSQLDKQIEIGTWSSTKTTVAPSDGRRFIGDWSGRSQLVCNLKDLPKHDFIRLKFNLLVLKTADGSKSEHGPDIFSVMTRTGVLLLEASFCNKVVTGRANPPPDAQSYPDHYPFASYPAGKGSMEMIDMGFHTGRDMRHQDSVYEIELVFPHTDTELALKFFAAFGSNITDESWGIRKVKIDAISGAVQKAEAELEAHWKELNGDDPVAANKAKWRMVEGGKRAYRWINNIQESKQNNVEELYRKHLPELEADTFKARKAAKNAIAALGQSALPFIKKTLEETDDPETKFSLREIVQELNKKLKTGGADRNALVQSRIDHVLHLFEASERVQRISTSLQTNQMNCFLGAANDGRVPRQSKNTTLPHCTWHPEKKGSHWLQYDFVEPRELSTAEVFWFISAEENKPQSWEIQYQDQAGKWIPVKAKGQYTTEPDRFNRVEFEPITTRAVRLAVELSGKRASAVFEFRVGKNDDSGPEPK